ncbi:hypothetical protein [Ohessyouella blattaphilus]|uniref:Uncharacterized protein n=1 Tax=Ohessyouella blattaphilus TaxID=2949333 RepID=A0ABT1EK52_9FIRM|nr:hypothetical protein [Ohessyouella blattaphilus]MCP1111085.1 hypothetical protein [Ohessyouella blattaphilus]MCR8564479.1 hypothetical protein [Ohessyouella blattaphilus]
MIKKILFWVGIIIVSLFAVPLFINWLFIIPAPHPLLRAEWEAGSALEFYGSIIGGAVTFGALAVTLKYEARRNGEERRLSVLPILSVSTDLSYLDSEYLMNAMIDFDFKSSKTLGDYKELPLSLPLLMKNDGLGIARNIEVSLMERSVQIESSNYDRRGRVQQIAKDDQSLYALSLLKSKPGKEFDIYIEYDDILSNRYRKIIEVKQGLNGFDLNESQMEFRI